mmetsp:Transcript_29381/g.34961  ORF Transcript_29381/g.34961 Transcript_29381/m.34961 type:complete len:200 (+) Transcript_29381:817-1416(+)
MSNQFLLRLFNGRRRSWRRSVPPKEISIGLVKRRRVPGMYTLTSSSLSFPVLVDADADADADVVVSQRESPLASSSKIVCRKLEQSEGSIEKERPSIRTTPSRWSVERALGKSVGGRGEDFCMRVSCHSNRVSGVVEVSVVLGFGFVSVKGEIDKLLVSNGQCKVVRCSSPSMIVSIFTIVVSFAVKSTDVLQYIQLVL